MDNTETRNEILKRINVIKYRKTKRIMTALSIALIITAGGLVYSMGTGISSEIAAEGNRYFGTLMLIPKGGNVILSCVLCFVLGIVLASMIFVSRKLKKMKKETGQKS